MEFEILKQYITDIELEEGVDVDINGILLFRLKEFKNYVNEIVNSMAQNIILQKEYSNVLKLMKFTLLLNKPSVDVLHIVFSHDEEITIYYEKTKGSVGANRNFFDNDLHIEDFLVDTILELCPSKIVVHNINYIKSRKLSKMLYKLYENKLQVCSGCNKCSYMHFNDSVY